MDTRHLKDVLLAVDELESLLRSYELPRPNPAVLSKVEALCNRMRGADNYITEKAGTIQILAAQFFSARKHANYPGGADELHQQIAYALPHVIRQQANYLLGLDDG